VFVGLAFAGAASALAAPSCNAQLAASIPARTRALAFGIKQAAVPLATLVGGLAVPAIALTVGWRVAYLIPVAVAVGAWVSLPDAGIRRATGPSSAPPRVRGTVITVLAAATAFGSAAGSAVGAFTVPALVDAGVSAGAAGRAAAIGGAAAVVARVVIGAAQDRVRIEPLGLVAAILAGGTIALVVLATGPTRGLAFLVPLAFVGSWGWPGLYSYAVVQAFPEAPAAASGYTQAGAFSGAALGPFVFGLVAEGRSFAAAFGFLAGLAATSAVGMGVSGVLLARRSRSTAATATGPS
jgi:predicted MFS family arabinose efflux permease